MKILITFLLVAVSAFADVNVLSHGANGNGVVDNTAAFQSAINVACIASGGAPDSVWGVPTNGARVIVPKPTAYYRFSAPITIPVACSIEIEGEHLPTLYWPTSLIGIDARYSVMPAIKGVRLQGNNVIGSTAIRLSASGAPLPAGPYMMRMDRNMYVSWGGPAIEVIHSDFGLIGLSITDSQFFTDGTAIKVNGPTDMLEVEGNQFTVRAGWCVEFNGGIGAASVRLDHNNLTCASGAVKIGGNAGIVTLRDNEHEQHHPIFNNPKSAAFVIEHASRVVLDNNTSNMMGRGDYSFWIGGDLWSGDAEKNTSHGANKAGWRIPANLERFYFAPNNLASSGTLYEIDNGGSGTPVPPPPNPIKKMATQTFTSNDSWVVPAGVSSITVKAWGAGGGGGAGSGGFTGQPGGGGGFAQATISVTPAESLTIEVGGGGGAGIQGTAATGGSGGSPGGGAGGTAGASHDNSGGGGGGYSAVKRSSTFLAQAGGGGGGGAGDPINGVAGGAGGAGGGTSGLNGVSSGGSGGTGGTSSAGGDSGGFNATTGSANQGGVGGSYSGAAAGGGGGGGGRYGGGGGNLGGGGGGSSLVTGTSTTETQGSGTTPANSGDADYVSGKGVGGAGGAVTTNGTAGGPGLVVIIYEIASSARRLALLGVG